MKMKSKIEQDIKFRVNQIEDEQKKKIIKTIIDKKEWYYAIKFDTYISIMQDLGYDIKETKDIYIYLNTNNKD